MSTATANDLVNNPKVQKYISQIDSDADAALALADTVIKSPTGKLYSSKLMSTYKADAKRLDTCYGNFNAAWNKVAFGKAKDNKEIIKTYTKYVLALEVLEQSNSRHYAMMTAGFAIAAAALCKALLRFIAEMKKQLVELEKELKALEKLLKKAKREVTEAKAQMALNIAITAVSFCLGPVGWGARIGVAVGGLAAHSLVDAALGPSKGSLLGTANTAAGESVELVDKLSPGAKKLGGAASALITLKMDAGEIGDAEQIVKEVQIAIRRTSDRYIRILGQSKRWAKDISKLKKSYDNSLSAYNSAAGKFKSSQRKRDELLKEFKAWK